MIGDGQPYKAPTAGVYRLVYSGDDALREPAIPPEPAALGPDADAAAIAAHGEAVAEWKKARAAAIDEYSEQRRIARETGDYSGLIVPGKKPTFWIMEWLPKKVLDRWEDKRTQHGGDQGVRESASNLVLLALASIENLNIANFPRVERVFNAEFGVKAAPASVLDQLMHALGKEGRAIVGQICSDLAVQIYVQEATTRPL